ncbi:hypothetical protein GBA52_011522 [Prunus armeniaca]|nr:hypothetical protein GBA52_011522 [Prunus armeniaca]
MFSSDGSFCSSVMGVVAEDYALFFFVFVRGVKPFFVGKPGPFKWRDDAAINDVIFDVVFTNKPRVLLSTPSFRHLGETTSLKVRLCVAVR